MLINGILDLKKWAKTEKVRKSEKEMGIEIDMAQMKQMNRWIFYESEETGYAPLIDAIDMVAMTIPKV